MRRGCETPTRSVLSPENILLACRVNELVVSDETLSIIPPRVPGPAVPISASAPHAPFAKLRVRAHAGKEHIRRERSESSFGEASEHSLPLPYPPGAKTERRARGPPEEHRARGRRRSEVPSVAKAARDRERSPVTVTVNASSASARCPPPASAGFRRKPSLRRTGAPGAAPPSEAPLRREGGERQGAPAGKRRGKRVFGKH